MQFDARGLPLTSDSAEAVAAYNTAIARYFEYRVDTGKHVKAALDADPGFVMARCFQGYLFMLFGSMAMLDKARASPVKLGWQAGCRWNQSRTVIRP